MKHNVIIKSKKNKTNNLIACATMLANKDSLEKKLIKDDWNVSEIFIDTQECKCNIDIIANKSVAKKNYLLVYKSSKRSQDFIPLFEAIEDIYKEVYDEIYFFHNSKSNKLSLYEIYYK